MSQKLSVSNFEWIESWSWCSWSWCSISRKIIRTYNDLPILPERMKLKKVESFLLI